jgi:hypothetical protein
MSQSVTVNMRTGAVAVDHGSAAANGLAARRAAMQCSPMQMRLALLRAGLLSQVEAIVADDPEASIAWEYATVIERTSPFISALGSPYFTDDQIDAMFCAAMQI